MRISVQSKSATTIKRVLRQRRSIGLPCFWMGLLLVVGLVASCSAKPGTSPGESIRPGATIPTLSKDTQTPEIKKNTQLAPTKILMPQIQATWQPTVGLTADMKSALDAVLAGGGDWHAEIHDPDGKVIYAYQANSVIHPASTIKIAIAMLILDWLEKLDGGLEKNLTSGPNHAGRSYEQLLRAMLVPSEEDAAQILQDAAVEGLGWGQINQLLIEWGAPNTRLVPRRSTAADMSNLLIDLYRQNLPSPKTSRIILDLLAIQTPGDNVRLWKLKDVLPEGAVIYNKRGSLTDPVIVADVGIILLPERGPFYICIFGYSHGDVIFEDLDKTIGRFALEWYRLFARLHD